MTSEIELDDQMTEESKNLVTLTLKAMKPIRMITMDVNFNRKILNENAAKRNALLTFPDVSIRRFFVTNPIDKYNIEVTCYKPISAKDDAPVTVFFHGGGLF